MKYETQNLLSDLQNRIELILSKAISQWQMLPEEKLNHTTDVAKWSAAQCLMHLNSYGRYYLPAIEQSLNNNQNSEAIVTFKSSFLGNYFYESMLPKEGTKKMRSPKDHLPATNVNTREAIAEFIDQSERLLLLLEKAKQVNISKAKVPISIAKFIKLQLGDAFLFLIAHIERHVLQAEKMLDSAKNEKEILSRKAVA